jgi:hypothetical protein
MLSGSEEEMDLPNSDTAKSSSAGGFSLNTSFPFVASSGSSGSLRLKKQLIAFRLYIMDLRKENQIWNQVPGQFALNF